MVSGLDDASLVDSRWALVVNGADDSALLAALLPLIRHRAAEQGITLKEEHLAFRPGEPCSAWYYRLTDEKKHRQAWHELPPVMIYRAGDNPRSWLARYGVAIGPVDPSRGVPYYLALAGRPGPLDAGDSAYIPFEFQYELDLYWGVGRICFTDAVGKHRLRAYNEYAERLIEFEGRPDAAQRLERSFVYFGTRHEGDKATNLSASQLIRPLYEWHQKPKVGPGPRGFERRLMLEGDATRSNLTALLHGPASTPPPAVLFVAAHGAGLPVGHPDLLSHQGALICQEWGGGQPQPQQYFTGADLGKEAAPNVEGSVVVLMACYGGGSPAEDQFVFDEQGRRPQIAPFPFVAQLPQQLLLNGAQAVLSHVDRAWSFSFSSFETPSQSQHFEDLLSRLAQGKRLGFATDQFNVMQSYRGSALADLLLDDKFGKQLPDLELATYWMARNDARNFALLGDPAARLPFAAPAP